LSKYKRDIKKSINCKNIIILKIRRIKIGKRTVVKQQLVAEDLKNLRNQKSEILIKLVIYRSSLSAMALEKIFNKIVNLQRDRVKDHEYIK